MSRKKREPIEFRYYDVPQDEAVLALLGESWDRTYGHDADGVHIHFHNLMEIGLCIRGDGEMILGERRERYTSGMFTLIPVNYLHTTISDGEGTNAWEFLFFDPTQMVRAMEPDDPAQQRALLYWLGREAWLLRAAQMPQLASLIRLILEEMRGRSTYYRPAVQKLTEALILLILRWNRSAYGTAAGAEFSSASLRSGHGTENESELSDGPGCTAKDSSRIDGVLWSSSDGSAPAGEKEADGLSRETVRIFPVFDYVNEHFSDPLRVQDLARACSMSETHVRRLFDEIMHMSPTEYINLVRIQKACELLKRTDEPLDLIASQCGYGNVSTFSRNFKKLIGVTPYQWKKLPDNYERGLMQFRVNAVRGW